MKNIFLFILLFTISCRNNDPGKDLNNAEKAFRNYFESIEKFDYEGMRNAVTKDFNLFEDGTVWAVEDHINFLKTVQGKGNIKYDFRDLKRNLDGNTAWLTYRNVADATMDGNPVHFEWLESAVLNKKDGNWKLAFLHSTTRKPSENSSQAD